MAESLHAFDTMYQTVPDSSSVPLLIIENQPRVVTPFVCQIYDRRISAGRNTNLNRLLGSPRCLGVWRHSSVRPEPQLRNGTPLFLLRPPGTTWSIGLFWVNRGIQGSRYSVLELHPELRLFNRVLTTLPLLRRVSTSDVHIFLHKNTLSRSETECKMGLAPQKPMGIQLWFVLRTSGKDLQGTGL